MAVGDTKFFAAWVEKVLDEQSADFGGTPNTIKCALIKSAANGGADPSATDAYPTWGAGGTTNLSSSEVTAGGNYTSGGNACANAATTIVSNVIQVDWDNPATWSQDASNPTNARWAVYYDDSSANKDCVGFTDLGSDRDMTGGDLQIAMGSPAFTITVST